MILLSADGAKSRRVYALQHNTTVKYYKKLQTINKLRMVYEYYIAPGGINLFYLKQEIKETFMINVLSKIFRLDKSIRYMFKWIIYGGLEYNLSHDDQYWRLDALLDFFHSLYVHMTLKACFLSNTDLQSLLFFFF